MAWICRTCGESHEDMALSFAADYPDNYAKMSEAVHNERAIIGSDQCIIDDEQFYIRGLIEIPIVRSAEKFLWGVWASLFEEDYNTIDECWEEAGRELTYGPFNGRLGNDLQQYPGGTWNLLVKIELRAVGQRPLFFVAEPEHPIAMAQKRGMTHGEVQELVNKLLHPAL